MKIPFSLLFIVYLITCSACFSSKKSTRAVKKIEGEKQVIVTSKIKEISIVNSFDKYNTSRNFTIESTAILDNYLEIEVMYSGGCAQHDFMLYTLLNYEKTMPPKLALFLVHDNNGDACREQIKQPLYFNVEPMQYDQQNSIQLIINQEFSIDYLY